MRPRGAQVKCSVLSLIPDQFPCLRYCTTPGANQRYTREFDQHTPETFSSNATPESGVAGIVTGVAGTFVPKPGIEGPPESINHLPGCCMRGGGRLTEQAAWKKLRPVGQVYFKRVS